MDTYYDIDEIKNIPIRDVLDDLGIEYNKFTVRNERIPLDGCILVLMEIK